MSIKRLVHTDYRVSPTKCPSAIDKNVIVTFAEKNGQNNKSLLNEAK